VRPHRLQDAVDRLSNSRLEVTGPYLALPVVLFKHIVVIVGDILPVTDDRDGTKVSEDDVLGVVHNWVAFHNLRRAESLLNFSFDLITEEKTYKIITRNLGT